MRLRDLILREWSEAATDERRERVLKEVAEAEEAIVAEGLPGERELVRRINRLRRSLMSLGRPGRGPGSAEISELQTSEGYRFAFDDDLTMIHVLIAKRADRWFDMTDELKRRPRPHATRVTDAMLAERDNVRAVPSGPNPVVPLGYRPPIDPTSVFCRICGAAAGVPCEQSWPAEGHDSGEST